MLKSKWLYLSVVFIFAIPSSSHADDGKWEKIDNPYKIGTIEEISIGYDDSDPEPERRIFAASASDSGWLWMTDDDGQTWYRNHHVNDHFHTRVAIQESDFGATGAGWTLVPSESGNTDGDAGPYRTVNGAEDWSLKATGLTNYKKLYALAADQSSTNLQTAFIGCEGNSDNNFKKLFKTTDGGDNWVNLQGDIPDDELGIVRDISICHDDPEYIYCAYEGNASGPAVYRSADGGDTWVGLTIYNEEGEYDVESATAVAVHPTHREIVAVVEKSPVSGNIYVSMNADDLTPDWDWRDCLISSGNRSNCVKLGQFFNQDPDSHRYKGYVAFNRTNTTYGYQWARWFSAI